MKKKTEKKLKKKIKEKHDTDGCEQDKCKTCRKQDICNENTLVMVCGRCECDVFENFYDPDEKVLYCDCARCGLKVAKFHATQLYAEDPGLEDMVVEGSC